MRKSHIAIIGAPLDLGAGRRGVDMGPSAVRVANLNGRLVELGYIVEDLGNVPVVQPESQPEGQPQAKYLPQITDTCVRLAEMVAQAGISFEAFGLEIEMGVPAPGMFDRDLFQISCLLDKFSTLGRPVFVTAVGVPGRATPDPDDTSEGRRDPGTRPPQRGRRVGPATSLPPPPFGVRLRPD